MGEEPAEEEQRSTSRTRPGRRERAARAAAGGDEGQEEPEAGDEEAAESPLSPQETALFRATAARANYLALDRPEVAYAAKELCRRMSAPRRRDKVALRRLCRYLLGVPRVVYHFGPVPAGLPLRAHAD